jgi:hypothetical protein
MNLIPKSRTAAFLFLLGIFLFSGFVRADSKEPDKKPVKTEGTVGGLLIDSKNDFMLVQLDDQDEPTKFIYGPGITLQGLLKEHIFGVDRVNVKFKTEGDDEKVLVAIKYATDFERHRILEIQVKPSPAK